MKQNNTHMLIFKFIFNFIKIIVFFILINVIIIVTKSSYNYEVSRYIQQRISLEKENRKEETLQRLLTTIFNSMTSFSDDSFKC